MCDREQEQCNIYSSLCQQCRPRGSQVFYLLIVKTCLLWKNTCVDSVDKDVQHGDSKETGVFQVTGLISARVCFVLQQKEKEEEERKAQAEEEEKEKEKKDAAQKKEVSVTFLPVSACYVLSL